jgi:hypothetical protein
VWSRATRVLRVLKSFRFELQVTQVLQRIHQRSLSVWQRLALNHGDHELNKLRREALEDSNQNFSRDCCLVRCGVRDTGR